MCYQTAHKYCIEEIFDCKCDETNTIVVMDEVHDSVCPVYHKFALKSLVGTDIPVIGLSATIDRKTEYEDNGNTITKMEMLNSFAPICYRYTLTEGMENGTNRELKVYIIRHNLSNVKKYPVKTKDKSFMSSEQDSYNYYHQQFRKACFMPASSNKDFLVRNAAARRAKILWTLPSKTEQTKKLLSALPGRTILFGNDVPTILSITPNTVCSHYTAEKNKEILDNFQSGKINTIGSFKMLEQGANLKNLQNVVMHSYYGKSKQMIQKLGRLRQDGTVGNVFIFLTVGTQEDVWFKNMTEDINLNCIWCNSATDCINKLTK